MDKNSFQQLAAAIIIQAARDYQRAFIALQKDAGNNAAKTNLEEVKEFFQSKLYKCLTDVPGETLMQALERKKTSRFYSGIGRA